MWGEGAEGAKWPCWPPGRVEDHRKTQGNIEVFGDGGCRGRIRDSARRLRVLREVLGGVPELILDSPEVPLEPLGVIIGHPGSILSSGFWFPGLFGIQNGQPSCLWQQRKSF